MSTKFTNFEAKWWFLDRLPLAATLEIVSKDLVE